MLRYLTRTYVRAIIKTKQTYVLDSDIYEKLSYLTGMQMGLEPHLHQVSIYL